MRVGDAFQAIVGLKLIAIWVREICVEVSLEDVLVLVVLNKRNTRQG